jgi:hypothetical protein
MTIDELKVIHALLISDRWIEAAELALKSIGNNRSVPTKSEAVGVMRKLFQATLDAEDYLSAATLQWGPDLFNTEPESVKRVFIALREGSTILLVGASSMSKTYSAGAFMLLDYLRDPLYTTVKLAAINEDHLRKNLFAHVATLYRNCIIPSKYDIQVRDSDLWMGVKDAGYEFGISGIAFKQSQETSGQFKGYKAKPVRTSRHPKFGVMSRLRVLGDEGQNWPGGPFKDFNSLVASKTGSELIKIVVAFNPESTSQLVVQMAEPEQGWLADEMDTLYDWTSKADWRVCRLDAAKSENVIQKKKVYEGLQTYEGFMSYLKAGGDSSANYSCFARGWPPMKGSINTLIPPAWPNEARGECTFIDNPIVLASVDLAFMGKDSAQMAVARWGRASGWRDHTGKFTVFKDRLNVAQDKPRYVLQIDQILPMNKHDDTTKMSEEIMARAKMLSIKPENLIIDRTSIGLGVHSHLNKVWGASRGVSWNEKATSKRIVSEDLDGADAQCDGVMSEMWWTFRRWLDPRCCAILINPIIPTSPINTELTSRRYGTSKGGKIKVEAKDQYKARNGGASPDAADACIMLTLLVRQTGDALPGLVDQSPETTSRNGAIRFEQPFKSPIAFEKDDSIGEEPDGKEGLE